MSLIVHYIQYLSMLFPKTLSGPVRTSVYVPTPLKHTKQFLSVIFYNIPAVIEISFRTHERKTDGGDKGSV